MYKKFRYLLKLNNGKRKFGEGFTIAEACLDAKVDLNDLKRATPVERALTDEEKKEKSRIHQRKRRRAIKLLAIARQARAEKLAKRKAAAPAIQAH